MKMAEQEQTEEKKQEFTELDKRIIECALRYYMDNFDLIRDGSTGKEDVKKTRMKVINLLGIDKK